MGLRLRLPAPQSPLLPSPGGGGGNHWTKIYPALCFTFLTCKMGMRDINTFGPWLRTVTHLCVCVRF